MPENKIELKSVQELLGMNFVIPSYQRGYRWTPQQVTDLLNDIWDFVQKDNSAYYCLQPLVVKKKTDEEIRKTEAEVLKKIKEETSSIDDVKILLKEELKEKWEVIDGQQRLTTIFIVLFLLSIDFSDLYSLCYETKDDFIEFLKDVQKSDKDEYERFFNTFGESKYNSIDYWHIFSSYWTIKKYFDKYSDRRDLLKYILLNKVKFIWYESVEENPIEVFTRLNIGKIPLTNAELIKALILNSSNFEGSDNNHLRLRQQEIASEWDNIEYTLQNDDFWLFLHELKYDKPTRIDFIFDLICERDSLQTGIVENIGMDEYKTFRYFSEYFKKNNTEQAVKKCWNVIKNYFNIFSEWFNDLEMFHYVGFLVAQKEYFLSKLLDDWEPKKSEDSKSGINKKKFIKKLVEYIKDEIKKCSNLDEVYEIKYKNDSGEEKKGSSKTTCRPLLLLHNIQTVINQAKVSHEKYQHSIFFKYPFHLHKIEGWDVEHIDSNNENELEDKNSQNEFLLNCYYSCDENMQKKIADFVNNPEADGFQNLKSILDIKESGLSEIEKNKVWNFALLDSTTNRSYGNAIFSSKRRIIIGKDQGILLPIPKIKKGGFYIGNEEQANSAFIPPCTKQIFLKYYSSVSSNQNYWMKSDAEYYKENIMKTLKNFLL